MLGYSDRINHAFTYLAKHGQPGGVRTTNYPAMAHPSNVAIILARHSADETTLVASILHHLLELAPSDSAARIEQQISTKFGEIVSSVASAAAINRLNRSGQPVPWRIRHRAVLHQVNNCEPRVLDIRCAAEIHNSGSAIAIIQRLGMEYLEPENHSSPLEHVACYEDLVEALERRPDGPSSGMIAELKILAGRLRALVAHG